MLHRVWKGVSGDTRMFQSASADGLNWDGEHEVNVPLNDAGKEVGRTSNGPALAVRGALQLVWKRLTVPACGAPVVRTEVGISHLYHRVTPVTPQR
jgi:hypothetical protein